HSRRRVLRAGAGQRGPGGHRRVLEAAGLRRLGDGRAGRHTRHGHAEGERRAQPRGLEEARPVSGPDVTGAELARRRHVAPRAAATADVVVTPASAGWRHLWFEVLTLPAGQAWEQVDEDKETCVVVLSGSGTLALAGEERGFEGRSSPFAGLPHALYA